MTTDTVHPKPTVLRVFPPPPTPRYWHRDGSTDKPTVAGHYGYRQLSGGEGWIIEVVEERGKFERVIDADYGRTEPLDEGYYWGPIVGPWQDK